MSGTSVAPLKRDLVIVFGYPGIGKTTIIKHLANLLNTHGNKIAHVIDRDNAKEEKRESGEPLTIEERNAIYSRYVEYTLRAFRERVGVDSIIFLEGNWSEEDRIQHLIEKLNDLRQLGVKIHIVNFFTNKLHMLYEGWAIRECAKGLTPKNFAEYCCGYTLRDHADELAIRKLRINCGVDIHPIRVQRDFPIVFCDGRLDPESQANILTTAASLAHSIRGSSNRTELATVALTRNVSDRSNPDRPSSVASFAGLSPDAFQRTLVSPNLFMLESFLSTGAKRVCLSGGSAPPSRNNSFTMGSIPETSPSASPRARRAHVPRVKSLEDICEGATVSKRTARKVLVSG